MNFYFLVAIAFLLFSCESRQEKFERETRENLAIMKKIQDSIDVEREQKIIKSKDTVISSMLNAYKKIVSAYYIETEKVSCNKEAIGFTCDYSKYFPINFFCDANDKSQTATFSIIGEYGSCSGSSIEVRPTISGDSLKFEMNYDSDTCEKTINLIKKN